MDLGIGLSGVDVLETDFGLGLQLTVYRTGLQQIYHVALAGADQIRDFFSDRVLLIPALQDVKGHVSFDVYLDMQSFAPGSHFDASFLVATVPEPSVLAAFASLLAILRLSRVRARPIPGLAPPPA